MTLSEQKIVDDSLEQVRALHKNISSLWDSETLATFYYSVLSGTIARSGPEVAQALMATLTAVYTSTAKSHVELGQLTKGFTTDNAAAQSTKPGTTE